MKLLLFILLLIAPLTAAAADSASVKHPDLAQWDNFNSDGVPLDADGDPISPIDMYYLEDSDTYLYGWKYGAGEWKMLKEGWAEEPEYDYGPTYGSNGGWSIS